MDIEEFRAEAIIRGVPLEKILFEKLNESLLCCNRLKETIDKAIEIYNTCCETKDFSTCDIDMYITLQNPNSLKTIDKLLHVKGDL